MHFKICLSPPLLWWFSKNPSGKHLCILIAFPLRATCPAYLNFNRVTSWYTVSRLIGSNNDNTNTNNNNNNNNNNNKNYMAKTSSWKADSRSPGQKISRLLWNWKPHYHVYKKPSLDTKLHKFSPHATSVRSIYAQVPHNKIIIIIIIIIIIKLSCASTHSWPRH
jgi:hypothetical protein